MDNRAAGEQLSQLARLLFNAAANRWYGALVLEILAGLIAVALSLLNPAENYAILGAIAGILLLLAASGLRVWFDDRYDAAETMRRQSVLTEALDWPIDSWQLREWRNKAGKRISSQVKETPRPADYYQSQASFGAHRLAEMTLESAFYTRQLYIRLRGLMVAILTIAALIALFLFLLVVGKTLPESSWSFISKAVYILIPVILSINILGWAVRLTRNIRTIEGVERSLLHQLEVNSSDLEGQVLRLVSEYNCQVITGFPIHNWLFNRWHPDILALWKSQ